MPLCQLRTNLPRAKVNDSFAKELSQYIASTVGEDEKVCSWFKRVMIQLSNHIG